MDRSYNNGMELKKKQVSSFSIIFRVYKTRNEKWGKKKL